MREDVTDNSQRERKKVSVREIEGMREKERKRKREIER